MRKFLRVGISSALVLGAGCLAALAVEARAQAAPGQEKPSAQTVEALFVSDIHFEPFWDLGKTAKLAAAPVSDWKTILASPDSAGREQQFAALQQACHARGVDTSYTLLESSLRAERDHAAGAKFTTVSGDLMSHAFSCKFAAAFPDAAPGDYRAFAEKTVAFVVGSLRGAFPGVPVYAALGNNDSDCGDYQLDANGAFLSAMGKVMTADLREPERIRAQEDFAAGGYFSAPLPPPLEHTRFLVLDNLFMSRRYAACGGNADSAPAAAQIEWLKKQLDDARQRHEKVWVMAHIPPGVDAYSTATKGKDLCKGNAPTMFLSSEALPEAMAGYGDVIKLAIFAHTHMDELRLLEPEKAAAAEKGIPVKMVASISPVDGNNPSFTVARVEAANATLEDYRVFVASNQTGVDATWTEEYDFAKTYKEPAFSAATLANVISGFQADSTAQTGASRSYIHNYATGMGTRELGLFWHGYVCALKNDEPDAYSQCVCAAGK